MKAKEYPPGLYNKFITYVPKKDGKTLSVIPLVLLFIMFSSALLAVDKSSPAKVIPGYIENRGQIVNEVYQPRPDILFVYQSPGFTLTLKKDGFSYQLTSVESTNSNQPEAGQFQEPDFQEPDYDALTQYTVNGVDVNFVKPYKGMRIIKQDTADYHFNYYNVKPSVTHVNVFNKIVYENIYKGIDLVFLFKEIDSGRFLPEYQWIIHPNGNINDISLAYNGMDQIYIDERGELFLGKTIGFVKESSPITFVENTLQPSALSFTLKGNVVSYLQHFKSDNKNVIIDPTIIYGIYYGGAKNDEPDEIAYSYNGYLYIAGNTGSPHNIIAGNPTLLCDKLFETGTTDAYLAQFAEDGSLKWGTYIGGDGTGGETKADHAFSVCVD
ncbi:MAG: hypothetical protein H0V61_08600, partial [Chitinophagales bacterium]|nr:hypothetical protein [Chitinophagales bacterium]